MSILYTTTMPKRRLVIQKEKPKRTPKPSKAVYLSVSDKKKTPIKRTLAEMLKKGHREKVGQITVHDKRSKKQNLKEEVSSTPEASKLLKNTFLEQNIKEQVVSRGTRPAAHLLLKAKNLNTHLNLNNLVITARCFGFIFLVGGSLLLSNALINPITSEGQQLAQVTGTIESNLAVPPQSTTTVTAEQTAPDVRVSIDGSPDRLQGLVPVTLSVSNVSEIYLFAVHAETRQAMSVGAPQRVDATTWRLLWNTTQFPNAGYTLKIYVRGENGSHTITPPTLYKIRNSLEIQETSVLGTVATTSVGGSFEAATATSNTEEATSPAILLNILKESPLTELVPLRIVTSITSGDVKVYAKNKKTMISYFVGTASRSDNREGWQVIWDSKKVPNGMYTLQAIIRTDVSELKSPLVTTEVKNVFIRTEVSTATTSSASTTSVDTKTVTNPEMTLTREALNLQITPSKDSNSFLNVTISVPKAQGIELFAIPKSTLIEQFVGRLQLVTADTWKYVWDTKHIPNGEYMVFVRVKNFYGVIESIHQKVAIANDPRVQLSSTQEQQMDDFYKTSESLIYEVNELHADDASSTPAVTDLTERRTVYIEPITSFVAVMDLDGAQKDTVSTKLQEFRTELNKKLAELAQATRNEDNEKVSSLKKEIEDLRLRIVQELTSESGQKEMVDKINAYTSQIAFTLTDLTEQNEKILRERIGESIHKDSDGDTVSDYDEINLYFTSPFSADSDNDAFPDGAEIQNGYNPLNPAKESLVKYESPKESGIVRDDLFTVNDIISYDTKQEETSDASSTPSEPRAIITGQGLPNSFVTLYIFSTPVVATVKTEADGTWSYVFDKEIENGEHEVYVGITDNQGRIVAKSSPFTFVKTAEAFTRTSAAPVTPVLEAEDPSFMSEYSVVIVGSLLVIILGLLLIILGIHAEKQKVPPVPQLT